MGHHTALSKDAIDGFIRARRLPRAFVRLIEHHYLPLADWLVARRSKGHTELLGINGAQGTGKSTLASFLELALRTAHGCRVAVLSIDDFYLTKAQRSELARTIHPLLATRGVPGTHDVRMLTDYLGRLRSLGPGVRLRLPCFDKANDDRTVAGDWPAVSGPVDLIILEGWCVGSVAQSDTELARVINQLERGRDPDGRWRRFVNERLKTDYAALFEALDALVFLQAPDFDSIYRWRLEQERKLAASAGPDATGIMDEARIAEFIQFYERITRNNLAVLPDIADVVLELDANHDCVASRYR